MSSDTSRISSSRLKKETKKIEGLDVCVCVGEWGWGAGGRGGGDILSEVRMHSYN